LNAARENSICVGYILREDAILEVRMSIEFDPREGRLIPEDCTIKAGFGVPQRAPLTIFALSFELGVHEVGVAQQLSLNKICLAEEFSEAKISVP
jgi:hypothetical protein